MKEDTLSLSWRQRSRLYKFTSAAFTGGNRGGQEGAGGGGVGKPNVNFFFRLIQEAFNRLKKMQKLQDLFSAMPVANDSAFTCLQRKEKMMLKIPQRVFFWKCDRTVTLEGMQRSHSNRHASVERPLRTSSCVVKATEYPQQRRHRWLCSLLEISTDLPRDNKKNFMRGDTRGRDLSTHWVTMLNFTQTSALTCLRLGTPCTTRSACFPSSEIRKTVLKMSDAQMLCTYSQRL